MTLAQSKMMLKIATFGLLIWGCQKKTNLSNEDQNSSLTGNSGQSGSVNYTDKWQPLEVVSQASLDDVKFSITQFSLGIQDYSNSQSPVLSYKIPRDADYVELMRCFDATDLNSAGTSSLDIRNAAKSLSAERLTEYYKNNDVFFAAQNAAQTKESGCILASEGTSQANFADSWAPDGKFFYLARACISNKRLVDASVTRYCSRRVAVTDEITYVNKRTEAQRDAEHAAALKQAILTQLTSRLTSYANSAATALDSCATNEHDRQVSTTMKNTLIKAFAIILETSVEVYNLAGTMTKAAGFAAGGALNPANLIKHFIVRGPLISKEGRTVGGLMKYLGPWFAIQGAITSTMFTELASSANDYPRSCYDAKRYGDLIQTTQDEYAGAVADYLFFAAVAANMANGNSSANGQDGSSGSAQ